MGSHPAADGSVSDQQEEDKLREKVQANHKRVGEILSEIPFPGTDTNNK